MKEMPCYYYTDFATQFFASPKNKLVPGMGVNGNTGCFLRFSLTTSFPVPFFLFFFIFFIFIG